MGTVRDTYTDGKHTGNVHTTHNPDGSTTKTTQDKVGPGQFVTVKEETTHPDGTKTTTNK